MFWWMNQLGSCFNYIRIRDGEHLYYSKRVFDFIIPAVLAFITTVVHFGAAGMPSLFGEGGVLSGFRGLFELLAPFFLAALAAVATFGSPKLESSLRGNPAVLTVNTEYAGHSEDIQLTRRQFICYLFGYLCSTSLVILVLIILGDGFAGWIATLPSILLLQVPATFVCYFLLWHVLSITMLGIYFLTDRIHAD